MSHPESTPHQPDTLDRVLGLAPGSVAYEARHQRAKVVDATQASEDLLLGAPIEGLSVEDRLLVALLASSLTPASELAREYTQRLKARNVADKLIDAVSQADLSSIDNMRLKQILAFTQTLIIDPVKADKQALLTLQASGLTTPQITALAQLIAFVSYQVRVAAGLRAMNAWGAQQ